MCTIFSPSQLWDKWDGGGREKGMMDEVEVAKTNIRTLYVIAVSPGSTNFRSRQAVEGLRDISLSLKSISSLYFLAS